MGEPAAAEAAASERDVLLATKLNVPGVRPDLVPRPRLARRVDEGWGHGLVLACAPAGYGKTVLLAEWVRRGGRPVAGLFVVPLDEVRGWWRYHHLFADLLRARLQQESPGRAAQLHRNAASLARSPDEERRDGLRARCPAGHQAAYAQAAP